MTYSLRTLNASPARSRAPSDSGASRFGQEIGLLLGMVALIFAVLALVSHSPFDPAWSTSGEPGSLRNWGGRLGAWLSDMGYFMLGFSVWWCLAAGLRAWLAGLARWMRSGSGESPAGYAWSKSPRGLCSLLRSGVSEWRR